jgi:hypothetical protein
VSLEYLFGWIGYHDLCYWKFAFRSHDEYHAKSNLGLNLLFKNPQLLVEPVELHRTISLPQKLIKVVENHAKFYFLFFYSVIGFCKLAIGFLRIILFLFVLLHLLLSPIMDDLSCSLLKHLDYDLLFIFGLILDVLDELIKTLCRTFELQQPTKQLAELMDDFHVCVLFKAVYLSS